MAYDDLKMLFATHVVELVAVRRNPPPPGMASTRRFLATNSKPLLNSIAGKTAFHFKAPSKPPPYDARKKNLLTVFDLYRQEYRNINLNNYKVLGGIPVRTEEEINEFWQNFFTPVLSQQSAADKLKFMNS